MIRTVGSSRLRLLADTFHMNIEETSIVESLKAASQYLGHMQRRACVLRQPDRHNRKEPSHGN